MPFYQHFPFFIIMIPMLFAVATTLLREAKTARAICVGVQIVLCALSLGLLLSLWQTQESFTYMMGHFPAPWGNELRAGPLEAMLSLAFSLVMLFSLLGGSDDAAGDIPSKKSYLFYMMMNLLTTSLMALVYTNDIFTAYVFIEINTIAACAIVVAKESGETVKATIKYMIMSVLGSGLFLLSTTILYSITGHLLMQPAHEAITALAQSGDMIFPLTVTLTLYAVAVAVKSALFPFHTWLPDAHGSATTTSSAVLSGLVLKGYIVLLVKLLFRVYGIDVVNQLGILPALFGLGLAGMIVGSVVAFAQTDLKRMIAYSSVAQIGYIFMGIGLNTPAGFTAACFHIIAHAFTKSMLFIAAGSLIKTAGSKDITALAGAAKKNKTAGLAFVVGSLSMIGVPLFAGFASKFYLANAAMQGQYGTFVAMTVLALSTFLNALYYVPVLLRIYSSGKQESASDAPVGQRPKMVTVFTLLCLMAANIALGLCYNPILNAIEVGFTWLG